MFSLPGYIIYEKIYESNTSRIYRGHTARVGRPVVIKVLKEEAANAGEISKLINEWEITRNLEMDGVIKPIRLEKAGKTFALIMEDIGAVPLSEYIKGRPVDVPAFLDIAVQLAETLGELHQNGIIHMNLKPENILMDPGTGRVKITGFSKAVPFSLRSENALKLERAEDAADYCSDYYSLGAVFYEMLTGRPPFKAENPAARLNARSAENREAAPKNNSYLPPALCAVIMKMLSEIPGEGYQSAYGIVMDLEECRRQYNLTGEIEPFSPGRMDISPRFELSRGLYGREKESEDLRTAFERAVTNQGELIMVSGYAGVGKTMLVNEILKPMALEKGYFAYGKFDQLRQNIPYAPFATALGSVVRQLMTESREKLEMWRKRILRALGRNGAVITGLIPELEMIIGRQPPVESLQPKEAQNRFLMVFGNFIKAFARRKSPIVIFLDDLQWADLSSLQLIKYLCRDTGLKHLLLIGAYRDNELEEGHPLTAALEEISKEGVPMRQIPLAPFDREEVMEFVAGALHCPRAKVEVLAETLYRRTYGIPFFLAQLLKAVYDNNLINFNMMKGRWEWDMESIRDLRIPHDVAELIYGKLQKLPGETRNILKMASCIGSVFDMKTLSIVCAKPKAEISSILLPAVLEGLVLSMFDGGMELQASHLATAADAYEFLHDMVRQAAYSMFSEEERKKAHVRVGRLILQNTDLDDLDDKMLSILDHLNRGLDLISDPEERLKLAGYNLSAGRRAKASAAYDAALNCFKAGMELLPEDSWDSCCRLCWDLYLERAQCEYLVGDASVAERLFDTIIHQAETELKRADVYGLKMVLYAGMGKYDEAVRIGINALKNLGMKLPSNPGMLDHLRELLLYKWHMRNKSIAELAELPEMQNPTQRKVAQLLIGLILASCTSHSELYAFTIIKAGNHTIRYGNTDIASLGYIGYSITEGSVLGNYAAGHELAKVAVSLVEKYGKSSAKCVVYFTVGALIYHWTKHGKGGLKYLYKALRYAIEAGNVLIAGYSYCVILENRYLMGTTLREVLEEARKCSEHARRMKHENLAFNAAIYGHLASALSDEKGGLASAGTGVPDEDGFIKSVKGDKASLAAYYFSKMQLHYLAGDYPGALFAAENIKGCLGAIMGFMLSAECNFYYSLAVAAAYEEMPSKDKKRYMRILKKNQRQMKKWADACAPNFLHKYLLGQAEMMRIKGRRQEAEALYDRAIQSAMQNGYVQNAAIACELAARFYATEGRDRIAKAYMEDALSLYRQWGAAAKVQDMESRYLGMLCQTAAEEEKRKHDTVEILKTILRLPGVRQEKQASGLNPQALHRIIQDIAEQSDENMLPEDFLRIAVESAGADKGYLILEKDDRLFIEAAADCGSSQGSIDRPVPLEKSACLSKLVVRYVARTLEPVILNSGEQVDIFARDPYIAKSGVKSIACIPVQLRGVPVGVLYLENSLMEGVFTEERIELLRLLAGQMIYAKALQAFLERDGSEAKGEGCLPPVDTLTERETEVLRMIAAGLSNREIAEALEMTVNTVKTHVKNIYGKLQVNRRVQAVSRAKKFGIL